MPDCSYQTREPINSTPRQIRRTHELPRGSSKSAGRIVFQLFTTLPLHRHHQDIDRLTVAAQLSGGRLLAPYGVLNGGNNIKIVYKEGTLQEVKAELLVYTVLSNFELQ